MTFKNGKLEFNFGIPLWLARLLFGRQIVNAAVESATQRAATHGRALSSPRSGTVSFSVTAERVDAP